MACHSFIPSQSGWEANICLKCGLFPCCLPVLTLLQCFLKTMNGNIAQSFFSFPIVIIIVSLIKSPQTMKYWLTCSYWICVSCLPRTHISESQSRLHFLCISLPSLYLTFQTNIKNMKKSIILTQYIWISFLYRKIWIYNLFLYLFSFFSYNDDFLKGSVGIKALNKILLLTFPISYRFLLP